MHLNRLHSTMCKYFHTHQTQKEPQIKQAALYPPFHPFVLPSLHNSLGLSVIQWTFEKDLRFPFEFK